MDTINDDSLQKRCALPKYVSDRPVISVHNECFCVVVFQILWSVAI